MSQETLTAPNPSKLELAWFTVVAAATLAGIGASAALLVDYLRPTPLFCADTGGCAALRASNYGWVGSVPLPAFGLVGFVSLAVSLLLRGPSARATHLVLAGMGGTVAAVLIALQVSLGVFCKYCLVVDSATLVVLVLALVRVRREWDRPRGPVFLTAPAGAYLAAVAGPLAWGFFAPVAVPGVVESEIQKTPAGQVCVVDFVDYECPYCRKTHADFAPALESHKGKLRLVRKNVPLTSIHPHSMTAALAACCADDMGKGDEMAAQLFSASVDDLTPAGCEAMARALGLDPARFHACMDDPSTTQRVEEDRTAFRTQGGHGLPTIWIDRHKIEGAQGPDVLRRAVDAAVDSHGS